MSKIKIKTNPHMKAKLRASLRRKEENRIKNKRMRNAQSSIYSYYNGGYFIRNQRRVGKHLTIIVPEKEITDYEIIEQKKILYDENGEPYTYTAKRFRPIKTVVPAHEERTRSFKGYIAVKPYLKRFGSGKPHYKKMANERIRNTNNDIKNGSHYKKFYDIKWNLW